MKLTKIILINIFIATALFSTSIFILVFFSEIAISVQAAYLSKEIEVEESICLIKVNTHALCSIPQLWTKNSIFVATALGSTLGSLCKSILAEAKLRSEDGEYFEPSLLFT